VWVGAVGYLISIIPMSNYDQIKDYFLGQLPEEEQQQVEEQYFTNPESLHSFWADSNDLIDEYLRGNLSPSHHQKFEERLQQLPALHEKVETDRALLQVLEANSSVKYQRLPESTRRWSLSQWWSELSFLPLASAIIILIGIMIAGVWYNLTPEKTQLAKQEGVSNELPLPEKTVPSPVNSPRVLLPQASPKSVKPMGRKHPATVVASFLLSAEVLRGNEERVALPISSEVTALRLQLELNAEAPKNIRAVLQTSDGTLIKSWDSLPVIYQKSTSLLILNLSTVGLDQREYVIKLSGLQPPQEFHFRLQKK
jgi:hypothetical protein